MIFLLVCFWFLLSDQFSNFFTFIAFLSAAVIVLFDKKLYDDAPWILGFRVSWIVFIFRISKEIFTSAIQVTQIIWFKTQSISPQTLWVQVNFKRKANIITLANSITLTPGTMTLDVRENKLLAHTLASNKNDIDKIKSLIKTVD